MCVHAWRCTDPPQIPKYSYASTKRTEGGTHDTQTHFLKKSGGKDGPRGGVEAVGVEERQGVRLVPQRGDGGEGEDPAGVVVWGCFFCVCVCVCVCVVCWCLGGVVCLLV